MNEMYYLKLSKGGMLKGIYKTNSFEKAEQLISKGYKYISYEEWHKIYTGGELAISYDFDIV